MVSNVFYSFTDYEMEEDNQYTIDRMETVKYAEIMTPTSEQYNSENLNSTTDRMVTMNSTETSLATPQGTLILNNPVDIQNTTITSQSSSTIEKYNATIDRAFTANTTVDTSHATTYVATESNPANTSVTIDKDVTANITETPSTYVTSRSTGVQAQMAISAVTYNGVTESTSAISTDLTSVSVSTTGK